MDNLISERAMLATLSVSKWEGRMQDRAVTREVTERKGADANAGRFNKDLIGRDALAPIVSAEKAARMTHYHLTLPWLDNGARVLSSRAFEKFSSKMSDHRRAFESAVDAFLDAYPGYIEGRRRALGDMFDPAEYPSASNLKRSFRFDVDISALPTSADFRANIDSAQAERIKADIEERFAARIRVGVVDVLSRIEEAAGKMGEKLRQYKPAQGEEKATGIFRDSLVENVRELVSIIPALNVMDDPKVAEMAHRMSQLTVYDATELREDDCARQLVAEAADEILAQARELMG